MGAQTLAKVSEAKQLKKKSGGGRETNGRMAETECKIHKVQVHSRKSKRLRARRAGPVR